MHESIWNRCPHEFIFFKSTLLESSYIIEGQLSWFLLILHLFRLLISAVILYYCEKIIMVTNWGYFHPSFRVLNTTYIYCFGIRAFKRFEKNLPLPRISQVSSRQFTCRNVLLFTRFFISAFDFACPTLRLHVTASDSTCLESFSSFMNVHLTTITISFNGASSFDSNLVHPLGNLLYRAEHIFYLLLYPFIKHLSSRSTNIVFPGRNNTTTFLLTRDVSKSISWISPERQSYPWLLLCNCRLQFDNWLIECHVQFQPCLNRSLMKLGH